VLAGEYSIVHLIDDEFHRSQYDFIDGFARHMRDALPRASFIGFTGTPIELADANTRAVFGDYISIYDIQRAVEDGATVPIYYESRLAKLDLPEELKPRVDAEFKEVTEGEEIERKERLLKAVTELSKAFALAVPDEEALRIRDDVAFFQAVAAALAKRAPGAPSTEKELDHAIRQIVSKAIAPEGVVDLFAAAGLKKPDISILSDEFLAEVRGMPQRNLAVEILRKLLEGEIKTRWRKNVVQAQSFADMLEQTIRRYQNRAIEAAQVIEELIGLARDMREANARGEKLGLSEEELAFYDALETNDSAVKVLDEPTLRQIAQELVRTVRANVTIDWTLRENVRAQLRVLVKRILRKHGYPPDKQEKATETVLEQAALLSADWA
jgi:type I restriction enzyme, R subunit